MVILHIARVSDDPYNGVCNVVPMHIISQQAHTEVALLNITPNRIENIKTQFTCEKKISDLSAPFNKPDLVVFHEIYYPVYLSYSRELRKRNIPYIIIPHGGLTKDAQNIKKLKKQIANPLLFNRFIYGAKAVQCLSQFELDATKKHNTKFVATNGIAVPKTKKASFNNEKIQFVYIGRIAVYHKGLDILLEAVNYIKEYLEEKKCVFSIYGPSEESQYEKMKSMLDQHRLHNIVKLHPAVSGEEKEKVLLDADIFIQTSRFEGMPMGILEAQSYGVPCLVTKGTTLGDFITQYASGWVSETDSEAVAGVIKKAISDRDCWENKALHSRKMIESEFSWDKVSFETIKYYEEILHKF